VRPIFQPVRRQGRLIIDSAARIGDRLRWGREYGTPQDPSSPKEHIAEAANWLKRAQDAGTDRGFSYGVQLGGEWEASYPETTGYIIPTFLALADYYQDSDYQRRAVEAGEWEIDIQMDSGAVMGGKVNTNPTPALFNTGQVLLGWSALYRRTGDRQFLTAARRAAQWMISVQEPNGNWIKGNSQFANPSSTVYNVKAAWGLYEAGEAGDWGDARQAALRNADYCLSQQTANGWFANCCLGSPDEPLLHTLAYTMQGLMGIGLLANRGDYLDATKKTARSLCELIDSSGFIPGKIDRNFRGTVSWCCLTGLAQTSIVWFQLFEVTQDEQFRDAALRANHYLLERHNITSADPRFRGGVFGSWPFWGDYGRNAVLNWATKFFLDALLLQERLESRR
jgi:hypothetical protein